jgi:hypothetical protein
MNNYSDGSAEYASLEALSSELFHRREDSIRSQIRSLFRSVAEEKREESGPLERGALHVYDMRNTLVHDGSIPPDVLSKVENEARELLEQLLAVQLGTAAHPRGAPSSAKESGDVP